MGFAQCSNHGILDKCIGAVGGLLIKLHDVRDTEAFRAVQYFTRKGFYAINVQAVCDADCRFLWYSVENPGSVHDGLAFENGSLCRALCSEIVQDGMYIVGDAAYQGVPNILTPFEGDNLPKWHDSFNFHLSQIRSRIESAFGILMSRFGIFWRGLRSDNMSVPPLVIEACILLHNFIISSEKVKDDITPASDMGCSMERREDIVVNDRLPMYHRPKLREMMIHAKTLESTPGCDAVQITSVQRQHKLKL
eukprot:760471-Hanusia_phi.AAC.3